MTLFKGSLLVASLALIMATGIIAASTPADAAVCRARMSGQGTGLGIAGQGTNNARSNALGDWMKKVEAKHGKRFANTANARSIRYDCRTGAILEAKCVVTAIPCR